MIPDYDSDDDQDEVENADGLSWYRERVANNDPVIRTPVLGKILGRLMESLPARAVSRRDRKVMVGAVGLCMLADAIYLNAVGFETRFAATQMSRYALVVGHCTRVDEMDGRRALVEALPNLFGQDDEEQKLKELFLSEEIQFDPEHRAFGEE